MGWGHSHNGLFSLCREKLVNLAVLVSVDLLGLR